MPFWGWLILGAVVLGAGAVAQWRGWIELRGTNQGRGSGNGVVGFGDEVFHPTKHEAQMVAAVEAELPAPAPTPGDGPLDLDAGRARIELPPRR
ncbi:MAG: hypothetical protein DI534_10060 [Leifsonia xyli]|nr:MAG: hypothetical protein DI534_10060 [Leifsonia xyli]